MCYIYIDELWAFHWSYVFFFCLMRRTPPRTTRTATLCVYTTLFRSAVAAYKHKPPLRSTISMKLSHRWPGGQTTAPTFRSTSQCFQHCAISLLFRHPFAHAANRFDGVLLLHIVLHRCRSPQ